MATNREIFDGIARSWYGFRHHSRFQKELTELALRWNGGRLLNIGCGHGADFIPFKDNFELFGLDFSTGMITLARGYARKFSFQSDLVVADAVNLPFKSGSFDWAIGVAVYHHIRGSQERQKAFRELRRVLKPGSEAFITVWNKWQPGFWFRAKDTYVPWRTKEITFNRYYHLFSYGELERAITRSGFKVLNFSTGKSYRFKTKYFSRNLTVLIKAV